MKSLSKIYVKSSSIYQAPLGSAQRIRSTALIVSQKYI